MNSLDIFFVIVLGFFLCRGIFRGLVLEISSIAGLVVGFIAANRFFADFQPLVKIMIPSPEWSQIVAYLGIFMAAMIAVAMLAFFLKNLLQKIMLGWLDRLGGGLLGLVKAGLICGLTLLILTTFLPRNHELLLTSKIAPHMHAMSRTMSDYLPEELRKKFRDKAGNVSAFLEESWEELVGPGRADL